jgi:hypothetical protein
MGYIPLPSNNGNLSANLQVGYSRFNCFAEYSQIVGLSSSIYVPKIFSFRSGYSFILCRELELRPFAGIGVMPATTLEDSRKAKFVLSGGCYMLQDIGKDFQIKYELSLNNRYVIPSIGLVAEF